MFVPDLLHLIQLISETFVVSAAFGISSEKYISGHATENKKVIKMRKIPS